MDAIQGGKSNPAPKPVSGASTSGSSAQTQVLTPAPSAPSDSLALSPTEAGKDVSLLFGNPYTDAQINASFYAAIPAAEAYALDRLAEKYPDINRSFASRFLQLALVTAATERSMVYSHEMGHFRAATAAGGDPTLEMPTFFSGYVAYNLPADKYTPDVEAVMDSAGVNQTQLNAAHMYERWARNGGAHYAEAMAYLLVQTDLALYAAKTARTVMTGGTPAASNDIANYLRLMNQKGHDLKLEQLVTMTLAADLLSAPIWASLLAQLDFLRTGASSSSLPTFSVGDLEVTFPSMHVLLTSNGPVVGGDLLVGADSARPLELSFNVQTDKERAAALGAKLYDVPLVDGATLNPFIRGTFASQGGTGLAIGTEFQAKLNDRLSLMGSVEYLHNDLLAEPSGASDGANVYVGVRLVL